MTKVERWWHWRLFCPCGWNEENEYGPSRASFFNSMICTECGRSHEKWELTKGRWNKDWDSDAPWTRADWEVWVDPDKPTGPPNNLIWSGSWWRDLRGLFKFRV